MSINSHKLIYITQQNLTDRESIKKRGYYLSKRIIIMPFLHERKIFTGVINHDQKYFNLTLPKSLFYDQVNVDVLSKQLSMSQKMSKINSNTNTHLMVSINFTEGFYKVYD